MTKQNDLRKLKNLPENVNQEITKMETSIS